MLESCKIISVPNMVLCTPYNVNFLLQEKCVLLGHFERAKIPFSEIQLTFDYGEEWLMTYSIGHSFNEESSSILDPWVPSETLLATFTRLE